jgi:hypothetical protein
VRRHTGAATTNGGIIYVSGGSPYINVNVAISSNGTFQISGMSPGSITLDVYANVPQGDSALRALRTVTLAAGETLTADISLPATGTVTGIVRTASGTPSANTYVRLYGNDLWRDLNTDSTGRFTFNDVQSGTFTLETFEPNNGFPTTAQVTVTQDQTTTRDLTLIGIGQVQVQVTLANGNPAPSAYVELYDSRGRSYGQYADNVNGRATFNNIPVGSLTIRAYRSDFRFSAQTNATLANNGDTITVTVALPALGTVRGVVRYPNGTAASNSYVQLFGNNHHTATYTNSVGAFTFPEVPVNVAYTLRAQDPLNGSFYKDVTVSNLTVEGQTLDVNITLPAKAKLRITVLNSDGTTRADTRIDLRDAFRGNRFTGYTDALGVLEIANVPEGSFTITARDRASGTNRGSATGTVRLEDDGQTINVTVNAPRVGNVEGTVFAADNQTPVRNGGYVYLYDAATDQYLNFAYLNSEGRYSFTNVTGSDIGFRVHAYSFNGAWDQATGNFVSGSETVTINVTLPLGIVRGTVTFADGTTPVRNPSAFLTQTDSQGNTFTYYSYSTDENGGYSILTPRSGEFTVTAQDGNSGLRETANGSILDLATPVTVNVTLPVSGVVTGTVRDADGALVPFADVYITPSAISYERSVRANAEGVYRFERIALGAFTARASHPNAGDVYGNGNGTVESSDQVVTLDITLPPSGIVTGTITDSNGNPLPNADVFIESADIEYGRYTRANASGVYRYERIPLGDFSLQVYAYRNGIDNYGNGSGSLAAAGNTATVNIQMPGTGTVRGTAFAADGTTPLNNTQVRVKNTEHGGWYFGFFEKSVNTDASGNYEFTGVPSGKIEVRVFRSVGTGQPNAGVADGILTANATATINVTNGNAISFSSLDLVGDDTFRYDVQGRGNLSDGGTINRQYSDAYDGAYYLNINSNSFDSEYFGRLEDESREVAINAVRRYRGLNVTRKIFSPTAGGFARYLEVLSNPTSNPVTVTVTVNVDHGYDSNTRVVVAPSVTSGRYAVTDDSGSSSSDPATAHIFGGLEARVATSATSFQNGIDDSSYSWQVTVPATRRSS